jgi:cytochrome c oxidase subunit 2
VTPRPERRRRARPAVTIGIVGAVLATTLAGCFPSSATEQGRQIHDLYQVFFVAGVIVAVIVWGATTWAILRYRRRDDRLPPQTAGNFRVEFAWTAIPLLTVLVLFGFTYATLGSVQAQAPKPAIQVDVEAFRWQWRFEYPDQGITIVGLLDQNPELVVPVGETIRVTLTSADVNHSFYVPAFLYKLDAIPGHPNTFEFTVAEAGTYRGQCAELCGVFHDQMLFGVRAVSPAEFTQWVSSQRGGT